MVHHLLTIQEGETEETALIRWRKENLLDHDVAMRQRKETYAKQKAEAKNTKIQYDDLVKVAKRMSPYGTGNGT